VRPKKGSYEKTPHHVSQEVMLSTLRLRIVTSSREFGIVRRGEQVEVAVSIKGATKVGMALTLKKSIVLLVVSNDVPCATILTFGRITDA